MPQKNGFSIILLLLAVTSFGVTSEVFANELTLAEELNQKFQKERHKYAQEDEAAKEREKQREEDTRRGNELLKQLEPRLITQYYPAGEYSLKKILTDKFKDPTSAKFRDVQIYKQMPTEMYVLCGEVNAKNGFGAYTGFKPFVSISAGQAIVYSSSNSYEENASIGTICNLPLAEE